MTTSDYLEQLVQDRDDLVDNLTEKGITGLTGDETFTELVPQVLDIPSGGGSEGWQRPSDWWDTETILANAEDRQDNNGNAVYPSYIILFDDADKQTTFSKSTTNKALEGDSYLTSDGAWYGTSNATHTWDESKDKSCSIGYKTRYVIVYMISGNKSSAKTVNLRDFPCLEAIFGDDYFGSIEFGADSTPQNSKIINVIATENAQVTNIIFSRCPLLKNVSFPNITTLNDKTFQYCYALESVSFPELITIGVSGFHGCMGLGKASFPKLTTLNELAFNSCKMLKSISFPKLEIYGTSSGTYKTGVFGACNSLESITFPNTLVQFYSTNIELANFNEYLKLLILPENFNFDLDIKKEINLTHSALVNIISKLKDLTGTGETHTITLGATNEAKLSADELAVITSKGWTLAS